MARSRSSGLFSGLVLISVGVILLLHNYGHLELREFFTRWWPLLIIFWGMVKLYERTVGRRLGGRDGTVSAGEAFLVLGMLALLGAVVGVESIKGIVDGSEANPAGEKFTYDVDVEPKPVPANSRVLIRNGHGDVTVHASYDSKIHVGAKKNVWTWSEGEADGMAKSVGVEIAKNGDAIEVRPTGYDLGESKIAVDLDVAIPKKSPLTVKTDKGDISIADISGDVNITDQNGDIEIRNINGNVSVELHKGDTKISDARGDVKISGKGGEIEVVDSTGSLTVDGDFYGPVRAERIAKGVRIMSPKTDLTVSALSGHLEASSGNLEIVDCPGNLALRTRDSEINVEDPSGKVNIDNRNAEINVLFSGPPKDDVTITNSSAGISLTMPGNSTFELQADCRNCDISSEFPGLEPAKNESGDSHAGGKYGSGRGPKIIVKTSYGNIALRRTASAGPPRPPTPPEPIPPETDQ